MRQRSFVNAIALLLALQPASVPCAQAVTTNANTPISGRLTMPVFETPSDPNSTTVSADAVQLADEMGVLGKLKQLDVLRSQLQQFKGEKPPLDLRQDIADLKIDLLASIDEARLDVDYVVSEMESEEAIYEEVLRSYSQERDARVDNANLWSFRSNGVLWAVSESLAIPTYRTPKLSIPSGTLGIIAGLVPSLFSAFAVRSSGGLRHERESYANILCKLYDLPTEPRTEFPSTVWVHLDSRPAGQDKTRRQILMNHWRSNRNIKLFKATNIDSRIRLLTGIDQHDINIDLLNDRLTMIRELKAVVLQMNRLLLELNLAEQGKKKLPAD